MRRPEKVLIVSRTKMGSNRRCIGGITQTGVPVRLLSQDGEYYNSTAPFKVGEVWRLTYSQPPREQLTAPHIENVHVHNFDFIQQLQKTQTAQVINDKCKDLIHVGSIRSVHGGLLRRTTKGSLFINRKYGIPDHSTGFWINQPELRKVYLNNRKEYFVFNEDNLDYKIPFVGEESSPSVIPQNSLIRISLARWLPSEFVEERCYFQISGIF